jgi:hypothetical protein
MYLELIVNLLLFVLRSPHLITKSTLINIGQSGRFGVLFGGK